MLIIFNVAGLMPAELVRDQLIGWDLFAITMAAER
jgi:hypothetical protein